MAPEQFKLATGFTVKKYKQFEMLKDKVAIADFIKRRFTERYIIPAETGNKHGFHMMAISCLIIEALESFYQGWPDSKGKGKSAFCFFFDRNEALKDFRGHAPDFYKHIRCGILHQGETTNGWRILRQGKLIDAEAKTINATQFLKALRQCLSNYYQELIEADWTSDPWLNCRKKMKAICDNCN